MVKYKEENKEKIVKKNKVWVAAHPQRMQVLVKRSTLKKYDLSPEEYKAQLEAQGGVCACCGKPETVVYKKSGKLKALSVDHCHKRLFLRALLCSRCNLILGHAGDSVELLLAVVAYLRKFQS